MSNASNLTIGRVTDLLKEEFPDVTMSKIRFLEARGLIHPSRSPAGYRQFHTADIERLRFILSRQRDHFLPLKVIKSQLVHWERGEARQVGEPEVDESDPDDHVFGLHEVARRASISRGDVRQLVVHGLLSPSLENGVPKFTSRDVAVAGQCGVLLEQGLEARHIRTIRSAVARQVELLRGLTVALRRNRSPDARRQATETVKRGAEAMRRLTDMLFLAEVRTILDED